MEQGHPGRSFGPLLRRTLVVAAVVLIGTYVARPLVSALRRHESLRLLAWDLTHGGRFVSQSAADRLERAGADGVPWLAEASADGSAEVRYRATGALARSRPLPVSALPALAMRLQDTDVRVRREVVDALARMRPDIRGAVPELNQALADPDPRVRFGAARALARYHGRPQQPELRALLSLLAEPAPGPVERQAIVGLIIRAGPEAGGRAIDALIARVDGDNPTVRREAIECLGRVGPAASKAAPVLKKSLGDRDPIIRCISALALSDIEGWQKGHARALLTKLVREPSLRGRAGAKTRWVLSENLVAGSEDSQPVHVLREVLELYRQAERRRMAAKSVNPQTPGPNRAQPSSGKSSSRSGALEPDGFPAA